MEKWHGNPDKQWLLAVGQRDKAPRCIVESYLGPAGVDGFVDEDGE